MDARKFGGISSAQLHAVGICSAQLYRVGFPRPHPFQVCSGVRSTQLYAGGKRPGRIGISTPVLCPQGGGNAGQFLDLSGWQDSAPWRPADSTRISSAQLYVVVDVANACSELLVRGIFFSVENPRNSYLWSLPQFLALLGRPSVRKPVYQACMHGASGVKWQALATSLPAEHTTALEQVCDSSQTHLPWGTRVAGSWHFATADECAYPPALCTAIAGCVRDALKARGLHVTPRKTATAPRLGESRVHRAKVTSIAGRQLWGIVLQQLVPEFREKVHVRVIDEESILAVLRPSDATTAPLVLHDSVIPVGSKLLRRATPSDLGQGGEVRGVPPGPGGRLRAVSHPP